MKRGIPSHHAYMETKQTSSSHQNRQIMSRKLKRVETDFSMTTQEPVTQVKATDVVIITVLTMIPTTIRLMTVEVSLHIQL